MPPIAKELLIGLAAFTVLVFVLPPVRLCCIGINELICPEYNAPFVSPCCRLDGRSPTHTQNKNKTGTS